jgi:hypothetical protein
MTCRALFSLAYSSQCIFYYGSINSEVGIIAMMMIHYFLQLYDNYIPQNTSFCYVALLRCIGCCCCCFEKVHPDRYATTTTTTTTTTEARMEVSGQWWWWQSIVFCSALFSVLVVGRLVDCRPVNFCSFGSAERTPIGVPSRKKNWTLGDRPTTAPTIPILLY